MFKSDLLFCGYCDPAMSSLFLHKIILIFAAESIALDNNDFVDSMLRDHLLNWLR